MIYLGDNWPDAYRGHIFMCNLHGNRVNQDILERVGSGYVAHHGKDFLFGNDPWFRGLCSACTAPTAASTSATGATPANATITTTSRRPPAAFTK